RRTRAARRAARRAAGPEPAPRSLGGLPAGRPRAADAERVPAGARLRRARPAGARSPPPSHRLALPVDVEHARGVVVIRIAFGQSDAAVGDDRTVPVAAAGGKARDEST